MSKTAESLGVGGGPQRGQPPARRGFAGVLCPHCGEDGGVTVEIADVNLFHCNCCTNDFDATDVREILLDPWQRVLAWCAVAPELPPRPEDGAEGIAGDDGRAG